MSWCNTYCSLCWLRTVNTSSVATTLRQPVSFTCCYFKRSRSLMSDQCCKVTKACPRILHFNRSTAYGPNLLLEHFSNESTIGYHGWWMSHARWGVASSCDSYHSNCPHVSSSFIDYNISSIICYRPILYSVKQMVSIVYINLMQ